MKDLLPPQIIKHKRPIKFLIAGGTATAIDLLSLYFFTDILGIWYLFSACLAFTVAFFASFFLQKFWTFGDNDKERMYRQMSVYLAVALTNLLLNAIIMFILVDGFKIWYMAAQLMASGLIAGESYFVYKILIFNKSGLTVDEKMSTRGVWPDGRQGLAGSGKILIASGIYPPDLGGPAQYAKNLTEHLLSQNHQVKVLSYKLEKKLPTVIRHILYFFRVISRLNSADFIIALDTFSAGLPAVLAAKIFSKKIIIRTGGDFLWESYVERSGQSVTLKRFYEKMPVLNFKEKLILALSRLAMRQASAVVFSTAWQREIFMKYYGLNPAQTAIVENYYSGKARGGAEPEAKNFVWLGRMIKLKNVDLLKSVFAQAREKNKSLTLETYSGLEHAAAMKILSACYALILPSLSEVSPNLILEAISFNKPFICTRETGFYEKLKDYGLFVDPLDKTDITNKILFLADDYNYRQSKSKIANFNFSHSWEEIGKEFINLYKNL